MSNSMNSVRTSTESVRDGDLSLHNSSPETNFSTPSLDNLDDTLRGLKLHNPINSYTLLSPQAPEFSPTPSVASFSTADTLYRAPPPLQLSRSFQSAHDCQPTTTVYTPPSTQGSSGCQLEPSSKGPPSHAADMNLRTHGGSIFGQDDDGEPLSCFLWVHGQPITAFHNNGPFASVTKLHSFVSIGSTSGNTEVFIHFLDIRDAMKARNFVRQGGSSRECSTTNRTTAFCITAAQFCVCTLSTSTPLTLSSLPNTFLHGYDGQVAIQISSFIGPGRENDFPSTHLQTYIARHVRDFTQSFGDIKAFELVENVHDTPTLVFHVEFFEHGKADAMVDFCKLFPSGWPFRGVSLWAVHFHRNLLCKRMNTDMGVLSHEQIGFRRRWFGTPDEYGLGLASSNEDPTTMPHRHAGIGQIRGPVRGHQNRMPPAPTPFFTLRRDNKNHVSLDKIRGGVDVRTTIMLRNIPNRVDQPMLKSIVDSTSFGKYDFMYLRIDFANNCNVGYAFINFQLPEDIIDFVEAVRGQRWFNSDKVAEVSYATMQGRECLVQKFRNSSVMEEHPSSRPKLYYTLGHAQVGKEEAFPRPDNLLKLARSNQNATHIGLFSPGRASNSYAHSDRHRRGQYDRGTSFADMEELIAENRYLRGVTGMQRQRHYDY